MSGQRPRRGCRAVGDRGEGLTTADIAGRSPPRAPDPAPADNGSSPLLLPEAAGDLRGDWQQVQASFVDSPRAAVEQADALVAGAMKRLAETFADERAGLERQWDRGDDVFTEELRIALQRYRAFFERLLAI